MKKNIVNHKIGKSVVKLIVIRGYGDKVDGYRLGGGELKKEAGGSWGLYNNGNFVGFANSCQSGKDRLVDLYIADVRI